MQGEKHNILQYEFIFYMQVEKHIHVDIHRKMCRSRR